MPHLFEEFKPSPANLTEQQIGAVASRLAAPTGPVVFEADALRDLMDIVKRMLGPEVRLQSILAWCFAWYLLFLV